MKKHLVRLFVFLYIAAFLFSGLAGVVTWADEPQASPPTDETTLPQTEQSSEEGISALLDMEVSEPEWMSYSDFVQAQSQRSWDDPAIFVGCHALLNPGWTSVNLSDNPQNGYVFANIGDLDDENGNPILLTVVDCMQDSNGWLWYKVEAAEGYTLPQALADKPYVLHLDSVDAIPTLLWMPLEGTFLGETVTFKKEAVAAAAFVELPTSELPATFAVSLTGDGWKAILTRNAYWTNALDQTYYDLGNTSGWHADLAEKNYHFVDASSVLLISPEVTLACRKLQSAGSAAEFNEIWAAIPDSVKDLILPQQMEQLEARFDQLCSVRYETSVLFGDISVPVSVTGPIPESGVALSVAPVTNEQVLAEGFDAKPDASDVIAALDIKLLKEDNTEWQPEDGQQITVTIGMAELGIADETVVRLHHKHGDTIRKLDIFLVLDGKVTVKTSGLSIFSVSRVGNTQRDNVIGTTNNGGTITLTVGQPVILYDDTNANSSSWTVVDTTGALHYTVHGNDMNPGNRGMDVPWIRIVPLRVGTVTLTFNSYNGRNANSETFTVNIVAPKAPAGSTVLYLKDDVNKTGRLIATLVDDQGNELSLAGAAFAWSRDDDTYISPKAFENDPADTTRVTNQTVNIAMDHGGLTEDNMNTAGTAYDPTMYSCVATLPDGTTRTATYTVYYQSEFINGGFEFPAGTANQYNFFPNGYPELYWKTTAQGRNEDIGKDIEYRDVSNVTPGGPDDSEFGVERAADNESTPKGTQFAELNAEELGALYQDIITAPGEDIEWSFYHAPRRKQSWTATPSANKMFVVIGATEEAQKLTSQTDLMTVCDVAKDQNITNANTPQPVVVTMENGAVFHVWYHDAGAPQQIGNGQGRPSNNYADGYYDHASDDGSYYYGWSKIVGSYTVPENQYRTRLFFVSDTEDVAAENFGNLIDVARAGQYKTYLIEYYEETFDTESQTKYLQHVKSVDESGEALIYSSVVLENLEYFLSERHDYLHTIQINGRTYPYSIRHDNEASLYIEKYPGQALHYDVANDDVGSPFYEENYEENVYGNYDIVMQIVLRDTVVGVQKKIQFPSSLTTEQKLKIMTDLVNKTYNPDKPLDPYGYEAEFLLVPQADNKVNNPKKSAYITARDPAGEYTGYISLGDDPQMGPYVVQETYTTPLEGLELYQVHFYSCLYKYGEPQTPNNITITVKDAAEGEIASAPFTLSEDFKIADVVVTNIYKEKMTEVIYKAVGTGKVQLKGTSGEVGDEPSETLAYYSGKAIGADAIPGKSAHFVGWYKDEACTQEVTAADGVYDKETGSFIPNTNIIEADTVTFYALFQTGSIVIERENGEPGETFTYLVEDVSTKNSFYVTVTCGENGKGSRTIYEVPEGTYRVTEIEDWSWRHTGDSDTEYYDGSYEHPYVFKFTSGVDKQSWLSGWSSLWKNLFKRGVKTIPEAST